MKAKSCLFCKGKLNYSFYPFCSTECQKDYIKFFCSVQSHKKKGDLFQWIKLNPDKKKLYARMKCHKYEGINLNLPHKKPLYKLIQF
jgi:hypothetical protein